MLYEIFRFEIKYRLKRPETYIYFVFLFLFSLFGVDFVFEGIELGQVKRNAPIVISKTMCAITGILLIIASMIMGVPILRDAQHNMQSILFVNPIRKQDYLWGRFLGSFVVLLFIFSGVLLGVALGEFLPWIDPLDLMPFDIWNYLNPFLTTVLPILCFAAALFFVTGALSLKLMVVYTQAIFLFVIFILTKSIDNEWIQAILDPFSLTTLTVMTEAWSATERNTQLIPLNGVLVLNKIFWIVVGATVLAFGFTRFNFNVVKDKVRKTKNQVLEKRSSSAEISPSIPKFKIQEGLKAQMVQLRHHSMFYFKSFLKQVSFWAIVVSGMVIILINSISLGTVYGVDSYPATYFIVEELQEMSIYFFIIILVFYSGDLIWKERDAKMDLIFDATPVSDFINLLSKFIGLIMIYALLLGALILSGILFQFTSGFSNYDLYAYFGGFILEIFSFLALYTFVAFFIHVIVNNKYVGHVAVLAFFIITISLNLLGYDHDLYNFGGDALGTYSDMNGYGHLLAPHLWGVGYWLAFCVLLFIVAAVLSVRGLDSNFKKRWQMIQFRLTPSLKKLSFSALTMFVLLGGFIFYNTNILNAYWSKDQQKAFRASYERTIKHLEYFPQLKVVDVNLKLELYPKSREYDVEGYYILVNKHTDVVSEVHVQKLISDHVSLEYVDFEGGAVTDEQYMEFDYVPYKLAQPLHPGDSIKMHFKQTFRTNGFEEGTPNTAIVQNGTLFDNGEFPSFGYNKKYELRDADDRSEFGLQPQKGMADGDNLIELRNARNGDDGYKINFEITIGTDIDQIAIAPGTLKNKWDDGDRKYFHYKMEKPMINFYSIQSARYEVLSDQWIDTADSVDRPIDLDIYYHKGHEYNLERMMDAMKLSLEYCSSNFSPYPYEQLRIIEFPRYKEFAQSFPTTIPFSEAMGFILDIDDEYDVDMAFYITAHEVAHQWWGLQLVAANVKGRNLLLESLAQYSAIMTLRKRYGEEKVKQYLDGEEEAYLKGKLKDENEEVSLALVEKQEFIYYRKGALAMYALQEQISEDNVNLALGRFLNDWNILDDSYKLERYATSADLLEYFREVVPDGSEGVVEELFEGIGEVDSIGLRLTVRGPN